MPATTITGLASGIEWSDTVDLMMQIESQPVERIINRQDEFKRKRDAWTSVQGKLETLQATSKSVDTRDELLTKSVSSSDTDKVTATATASAVAGNHTVIINQLAEAEVEVHSGWADLNSTPVISGGAGQFDYIVGGEGYSISVPDGTTLIGLVQLINTAADNIDDDTPYVVASTIDDGGAVDPLHLVLSSKEPGLSNTIAVQDTTTLGTGTEFDSGTFTETKSAQDSEIRVDGFPVATWITRETNTIDDVINGVTLSLKDADALGVTIQIQEDLSLVKQKINDWVDDYNAVMLEMTVKTRYDAENEIMGILMGDSQIQSIKTKLLEVVAQAVPDLDAGAKFSNLSSIGIDIGPGGQLSVNSTELQEALETDIDDIIDLFVFTQSSTSNDLEYFTRTEHTKGGTYAVQAAYDASGNLDSSGTNTIGGYAATIENNTYLVGKEYSEVQGLRIKFNYPGGGAGTTSADIRLGTGVAIQSKNNVEIWT
ncbi:MAG: flagellar filament capping protein FliD, partial [Candidatus Electryonea clarkiae]|nr:flagellar filament capping protein FliD [Candidatus Electryonea clarkiae]